MILNSRVALARERLLEAGIEHDEATLDARLLAEHALGWNTARYLTAANEQEPADFDARYESMIARRERREPLAYITGAREFWNLEFEVSPAVLIPRPETELIVEIVLERFPRRDAAIEAADICTGSGCLAITLARERPGMTFVATDVSAAALDVAARNARRHGVDGRIEFREGDLAAPLTGTVDLIVCNPPYVAEVERASLQTEVRDFEPASALFAGPDGLAILKRLFAELPPRLRSGGLLIVEFGFGQADAISSLIAAAPGLTMDAIRSDLSGIPRAVVARRHVDQTS